LSRFGERISDGRVLSLIERFLEQDILEGVECWTPESGTPQGSVLSPLLANLYLHSLDVRMTTPGYCMLRYADDGVVLCRSQAEADRARAEVQAWTEASGLTLHPDKAHVGNCLEWGQGFELLGYRFEAGNRIVRKKSWTVLKDKIRQQTKRTPRLRFAAAIPLLCLYPVAGRACGRQTTGNSKPAPQ